MSLRSVEHWKTRSLVGVSAALAVTLLALLAATVHAWQPESGGPTAAVTSMYCTVGAGPLYGAYDPVNQEVYVPNAASANLSILKGCTVVATVSFGSSSAQPYAAAFDPANNHVYVTDLNLNKVYVISGTTLIKTISNSAFNSPHAILYDPGDGVMAIANTGGNNVVFLANNSQVIGTNSVGIEPFGLGYDPYFARILVTDWGSDNVTSIDAIYPLLQSSNVNIPVGTNPYSVAFNFQTDLDYVTNGNSNNVTIFSGTSSGGHLSVSVSPTPTGIVWDQAKLSMYVVNQGFHGNVTIIKGFAVVKTISGPSNANFAGAVYDEATDKVYVMNYNTPGTVYIYS
jgi:DNA-binding beta-propeller fold protein YncE